MSAGGSSRYARGGGGAAWLVWAERGALAILLALGGAARLIDLGGLPLGAPETEEGTTWLAVEGQLAHGQPLLPSGLVYWKGLPYTLLASGSASILGLSELSLRLPSALAGIAAIALAWWTVRRALRALSVAPGFAALAALLASYVLALSGWSVLMSRNARFYELGLALFLAGCGVAIEALAWEGDGQTRWTILFALIAMLAAATFHAGVLLLVLLPVPLLMGRWLAASERLVLAIGILLVIAWFGGAAFAWRTGHVEAGTGSEDIVAFIGGSFWKSVVIVLPAYMGWWILGRGDRAGSRLQIVARALLALTALLVAVPLVSGGGPLRAFRVLAEGHPGLVLLCAGGMLALAALPGGNGPARRTAALLYLSALVPAALVGGSSAHFVPRYLLFAIGPLAITAMAGLAAAADRLRDPRKRWAGGLLLAATPLVLLPAIGPGAAREAAFQRAGDPTPRLFAASPSRPFAMDVAGPSRWVGEQLRGGDLVVSTSRSLTFAALGRQDYWYARALPSVVQRDAAGRQVNLVTGSPLLSAPEQLADLCEGSRVWVIVDPQSKAFAEVEALEAWLQERTEGPARPVGRGEAAVYLLERGCGRSGQPD